MDKVIPIDGRPCVVSAWQWGAESIPLGDQVYFYIDGEPTRCAAGSPDLPEAELVDLYRRSQEVVTPPGVHVDKMVDEAAKKTDEAGH